MQSSSLRSDSQLLKQRCLTCLVVLIVTCTVFLAPSIGLRGMFEYRFRGGWQDWHNANVTEFAAENSGTSRTSDQFLLSHTAPRIKSRKLLESGNQAQPKDVKASSAAGVGNFTAHMERVGDGGCSMDDIAIFQGETGPLPDGIPSFTVQIFNLCLGGCAMRDIHVSCGWFASATLVNPKLFKRLGYDDCIVNSGNPLHAGESLTFHYANSFQYPFSVANAVHVACPGGPGH